MQLSSLSKLPVWSFRVPAIVGWIVLLVLLVQAALLRFSVAPVAISEFDSWGWLKPALGWIGGLGFHEEYEREWLYGAFIAGCLRVTGSFAGYIIIQQVLGLIAAVFMWATWRTWISLFPKHLALEIGSTVVGLYAIAIFLFNPIARTLEMAIRPEAIMAFVAFGQLLCVAGYCKYRWHKPQAALSIILGSLAIPPAVAMYILKPNWLLAVPATTLPVFVGLFGSALPFAHRALAPVAGFLLVLILLWLPEKALFEKSKNPRLVLPMTLFTIHADIIRESMAAELASPRTPSTRKEFLADFLPLLDREMVNARADTGSYTRLGFDPDYLMYRATIFPTLHEKNGMSEEDIAKFCKVSFLSAVMHKPLLYAHKALSQSDYFFFPDDGTFFKKRFQFDNIYRYVVTTLPAAPDEKLNAPTRALFQEYLDTVQERLGTSDQVESSKGSRNFLTNFRPIVPWVTTAFLLSLVGCLQWKPLAPFRLPAAVALVFYAAPAGNAITVALVHALDNSRYRGSYGPLLIFALAAMVVFLASILACALIVAYRKTRRA